MNIAGKTVEKLYARRGMAAVLALLFFCFAGYFISSAKFTSNIYDLLPVSDGIVKSHLRAAENFKQSNSLYFNISGENAETVCDALAAKLKSTAGISRVDGCGGDFNLTESLNEIIAYAPSIFTAEDENCLKEKISEKSLRERMSGFKRKLSEIGGFGVRDVLVADPAGILDAFYKKLKKSSDNFDFANFAAGRISDKSGKNYLLVAEGDFDSSDSQKSGELMAKIDKIRAEILGEFPDAKILIAGGYRISADNASIASRDSTICFSSTLVLMFALCVLAFSTRIFAPVALLPSLFGTAAAFCAVIFISDTVAAISIGFASIAVGVSIDYAVHILYRLDGRGRVALADAAGVASNMARPVALTSGTTAIAFVIISFCGSEGFSQLGIFGAAGVIFSALASVFVLPAFVVGLGRRERGRRFFDRLADTVSSVDSKRLLYVAAALCIVAVPFAMRVNFNGNFSSLSVLSPQSRADDSAIREIWKGGLSKTFALVEGKSSDAVLCECARIEKEFASRTDIDFFGISELLPDSNTRAENAERWRKFWTPQRISDLKKNIDSAAMSEGINPRIFEKFFGRLRENQPSDIGASKTISSILKGRFAERKDGAAAVVFVRLKDGADKSAFAKELSAFSPNSNYIDMDFLGGHIARTTFDWLWQFAAAAFVSVAAYIYAVTRRLRIVAAVLLPVATGLLWCFGLMGLFGVDINIVNVVFVIFAVCVAQDYAVFLLFSNMRREKNSPSVAAVFISAFTTIFAFGTLGFAVHPVLRSLGLAASISIFSILCACIVFSRFTSKWAGECDA